MVLTWSLFVVLIRIDYEGGGYANFRFNENGKLEVIIFLKSMNVRKKALLSGKA